MAFWMIPTRTILGIRVCSAGHWKRYPRSSKSLCFARLIASSVNWMVLPKSDDKRNKLNDSLTNKHCFLTAFLLRGEYVALLLVLQGEDASPGCLQCEQIELPWLSLAAKSDQFSWLRLDLLNATFFRKQICQPSIVPLLCIDDCLFLFFSNKFFFWRSFKFLLSEFDKECPKASQVTRRKLRICGEQTASHLYRMLSILDILIHFEFH